MQGWLKILGLISSLDYSDFFIKSKFHSQADNPWLVIVQWNL